MLWLHWGLLLGWRGKLCTGNSLLSAFHVCLTWTRTQTHTKLLSSLQATTVTAAKIWHKRYAIWQIRRRRGERLAGLEVGYLPLSQGPGIQEEMDVPQRGWDVFAQDPYAYLLRGSFEFTIPSSTAETLMGQRLPYPPHPWSIKPQWLQGKACCAPTELQVAMATFELSSRRDESRVCKVMVFCQCQWQLQNLYESLTFNLHTRVHFQAKCTMT